VNFEGEGADLQNAGGFDPPTAKLDWGREQVEIFSRFEEKESGIGKGGFSCRWTF